MSTATAAEQREGMWQEMLQGLDPQSVKGLAKLRSATTYEQATDATVNDIIRPGDRVGAAAQDTRVAREWGGLLRGGNAGTAVMRPTPLGAVSPIGSTANDNRNTVNAPVFSQTTTINLNGADANAPGQVVNGVRAANADMMRGVQGVIR